MKLEGVKATYSEDCDFSLLIDRSASNCGLPVVELQHESDLSQGPYKFMMEYAIYMMQRVSCAAPEMQRVAKENSV